MKKLILVSALIMSAFTNANAEPYPPTAVKQYVDKCTEAGKGAKFCQCTIDNFQGFFTFNEFFELVVQKEMTNDPRFATVFASCEALYKKD